MLVALGNGNIQFRFNLSNLIHLIVHPQQAATKLRLAASIRSDSGRGRADFEPIAPHFFQFIQDPRIQTRLETKQACY